MKENRTGLIFAGGQQTPAFANIILNQKARNEWFLIAVDAGLEICDALHLRPDLILGDFDTVKESVLSRYERENDNTVKRYAPEKNASDLELALHALKERGIFECTVLGALGGRADHTFANIRLCYCAAKKGLSVSLMDSQNRIRCYAGEGVQTLVLKREEQWGKYISIFPIGGAAEHVTLEGFRYPLHDFFLSESMSPTLTVSNEVVGDKGIIRFVSKDGSGIIVMETRD